MNPYDFVRVEWDKPGRRAGTRPADRFGGISGRLEGTITALTPILIPDHRKSTPRPFLQNRQDVEIIPGSSLKGLFRSLVETVGGGAWWFFGDRGEQGTWSDRQVSGSKVNYGTNLPRAFKRPQHTDDLDAACRMFGFLSNRQVLQGRVCFDDAVCTTRQDHAAIYTCILSTPKPRHAVWYLDATNRVAGRKFYFHHNGDPITAQGWLPRPDVLPKQRQNAYIKPLGAGSTFTFRAQFTNLDKDDFALLLYALVLEEGVRHKLGYAKPAGLGSVHVQITSVELVNYTARYRAGGGGFTRYAQVSEQGDTLTPYIAQQIAPYTSNTSSVTLQDLRRIWQWPPQHPLQYKSQDWFRDNPTTPISET